MGFFKEQEMVLAKKLLIWHSRKSGVPLPDDARMEELAAGLVRDAHRIAGERGKNVLLILKEMLSDMKK
ncbi:MAG: hypothetical protein AB1659_05095 [Thermodesulfobacteriota bacterium]